MSKHYYQINHTSSILEHAIGRIFCKSIQFLLNHTMDGRGNNMILHYANMFIVEDNISQHLIGPSDQTGSHENLS